jgi:hypothetical protein
MLNAIMNHAYGHRYVSLLPCYGSYGNGQTEIDKLDDYQVPILCRVYPQTRRVSDRQRTRVIRKEELVIVSYLG